MKTTRLLLPVLMASLLAACQTSSPENTAAAANTEKQPTSLSAGRHGAVSEQQRKAFIAEHVTDASEELTWEAFKAFRTERFNGGDQDGNGSLSEDEYVDEYATRLEQQIAGERKGHAEQTLARFKALDKDKDGFISPAEYNASGDRAWQLFDKENTGTVKAADHKSAPQGGGFRSVLGMPTSHNISGFMEMYDESGEGVVTRADYQRQRDASFAATDANGDGKLSLEEYQDEFEGRVDRQANRVREGQLKQAHVRFGVLDTNKDKAISLEEYLASGERTFKRWDTNGDGVVSAADPLPVRQEMPRAGNDSAANKNAAAK